MALFRKNSFHCSILKRISYSKRIIYFIYKMCIRNNKLKFIFALVLKSSLLKNLNPLKPYQSQCYY